MKPTNPSLAGNPDPYNVVWDSPSADARGSMPIGNGDIALNIWVEPSGDVCFFIAKSDAWDENMRLLKLNKVRIRFEPALSTGAGFRQELKLREGEIVISDAKLRARVWVDANHPVVQVDAESLSGQPVACSVSLEPWRKEKRPLGKDAYFATGYTALPAFSYPDVILPQEKGRIGWYHRNVVSPWLPSLKLQKNESIAQTGQDPILNLTMGGIVRGAGFAAMSATEMKAEKPAAALSVRIHVLGRVTDTPEAWVAELERQANTVEKIPDAERLRKNGAWWKAFWERSWILASGADVVTRGYTLQRWINACGGRGGAPIKFNGALFTVDNAYNDPDHRNWGGSYWAQNTRMIYWPMLASGDFDLLQSWFDVYRKALPARKVATKAYYGHDGAFYPETFNIWGNYQDESLGYGLDRTGHPDGFVVNPYIRYHWQGGIEAVAMMLDYYDITLDKKFADETLLPFAKEIVTFYDQHWQRDQNGKIRMTPSQSLETWWTCVNPMPEVAGLRFVIPRLQQIAGSNIFQKTLDDLPAVPVSKDGKRLLPGEEYGNKRNQERPELYAVFPYRLYGIGKPGLEVALNTMGGPSGAGCWHQEPIQFALLGKAEWARDNVVGRAAATHPGFRFQAFWNQGHDWMPDQCHGGGLMAALQYMLLQAEGDPSSPEGLRLRQGTPAGQAGGTSRILLLPAWPKEWDVSFKLHAPKRTTIECEVKNGKVVKLVVTPDSRRGDVEICSPFELSPQQ